MGNDEGRERMARDERLRSVPPEVWAKMSPEERAASVSGYFEAQDARDGAGQLAAMKHGSELRRRIAAGEITDEQAEQELDDDLDRIGSIDDETWARLSPREAHEAMVAALGFDPSPEHQHPS